MRCAEFKLMSALAPEFQLRQGLPSLLPRLTQQRSLAMVALRFLSHKMCGLDVRSLSVSTPMGLWDPTPCRRSVAPVNGCVSEQSFVPYRMCRWWVSDCRAMPMFLLERRQSLVGKMLLQLTIFPAFSQDGVFLVPLCRCLR